MVLKPLFDTQMIWTIFMKKWKNKSQIFKCAICYFGHTTWLYFWLFSLESSNKDCKILIIFDYMIVGNHYNERYNTLVTELFIRGRQINISLLLITQFYFATPKNIRLNCAHYFIWKFQVD